MINCIQGFFQHALRCETRKKQSLLIICVLFAGKVLFRLPDKNYQSVPVRKEAELLSIYYLPEISGFFIQIFTFFYDFFNKSFR